jgi:hypothetical protein
VEYFGDHAHWNREPHRESGGERGQLEGRRDALTHLVLDRPIGGDRSPEVEMPRVVDPGQVLLDQGPVEPQGVAFSGQFCR